MSKNVIINGTTYSGVSIVSLPTSSGTATFKDESEITVPSGTIQISTNGTHNVKTYENAIVNVPTNSSPSGTIEITSNGTHDVTNYASAEVNVPVGITPSGDITITENGTFDVTNYASAVVNVQSSGSDNTVTELPVTYIKPTTISYTDTDGVTQDQTSGSATVAYRVTQHGGLKIPMPSLTWTGTIFIRCQDTGTAKLTGCVISAFNYPAYNKNDKVDFSDRIVIHKFRSSTSDTVTNVNIKYVSTLTVDGVTDTNNGNGYILINGYGPNSTVNNNYKAAYVSGSYFEPIVGA